mgnify:CR=1 FL=1
MKRMKYIKYMIGACALSFVLPLSAFCGDAATQSGGTGKQQPPFHKANVKKDAPELKPNIPEEYLPLIAEYDKYWKFVQEGNLDGAYEMERDEYKKVVTVREYKGLQELSKMPVSVKAVRALEVQKKDEKEVIVKGTMWLQSGQIDTLRVFYDNWVKEEHGWRHIREMKQYGDESKKNS